MGLQLLTSVMWCYSLEMLYLGGNLISSIPPEVADLTSLRYLVLCDNRIQSIPPQLSKWDLLLLTVCCKVREVMWFFLMVSSDFCPCRLHSLLSLSLHNNLLTFLPREILSLVHLQELSLRGNPLVVRFIKDMTYDPPSLMELAARVIKSQNLPFSSCDLPSNLIHYLNLASECPNPKCAGRGGQ